MLTFKLDIDSKSFEKRLGSLKNKMPMISRRMMSKVATNIRRDSRNKNLKGQVLNKKSGDLYKNISYKSKDNWTTYITASARYAAVHEFGGVINAKEGKYLTFMIADRFIKTKSVKIPKREFLGNIVREYQTSNKTTQLMEEEFEKQIQKLLEKG